MTIQSKLNALPERMTGHILSFLTAKEIVATRRAGKLFEKGYQAWESQSGITHPEIFLRLFDHSKNDKELEKSLELAGKVVKLDLCELPAGMEWGSISTSMTLFSIKKSRPLFPCLRTLCLPVNLGKFPDERAQRLNALGMVGQHCPQLSHLLIAYGSAKDQQGYETLLKGCPEIQSLTLQDAEVNNLDELVKLCPKLTECRITLKSDSLSLSYAQIQAAVKVPQLREIHLGYNASYQGVCALSGHAGLREVRLVSSNTLRDSSLEQLSAIPNLERLGITDTAGILSLGGLAGAKKLTHLKFSALLGARVNEEGPIQKYLISYPCPENILSLEIGKCADVDDITLEGMRRYTNLRILVLSEAEPLHGKKRPLTDKGLGYLASCSRLESLTITNRKGRRIWQFTTEGLIGLAGKLPSLSLLDLGACHEPEIDTDKIRKALAKSHPNTVIIQPKKGK